MSDKKGKFIKCTQLTQDALLFLILNVYKIKILYLFNTIYLCAFTNILLQIKKLKYKCFL